MWSPPALPTPVNVRMSPTAGGVFANESLKAVPFSPVPEGKPRPFSDLRRSESAEKARRETQTRGDGRPRFSSVPPFLFRIGKAADVTRRDEPAGAG